MQQATKPRVRFEKTLAPAHSQKEPQAARILAASETNTRRHELQAAMKLYAQGKSGDPKARAAIAMMVAKPRKATNRPWPMSTP